MFSYYGVSPERRPLIRAIEQALEERRAAGHEFSTWQYVLGANRHGPMIHVIFLDGVKLRIPTADVIEEEQDGGNDSAQAQTCQDADA